jgi:hypothetical protein
MGGQEEADPLAFLAPASNSSRANFHSSHITLVAGFAPFLVSVSSS